MDKDDIEASVLRAFEVSLEAQLKAIKRLRSGTVEEKPSVKGMSQVNMVYDIPAPAYLRDHRPGGEGTRLATGARIDSYVAGEEGSPW